jgi:error-prone DNA polymerase
MPGRVVVQWDKDDCADLGLIKVDLLGLGMMAVLEESLELIREAYGEAVDLAQLPGDDPRVYEALQKADTVGMFQVESRAQMATLPRLRPSKFYDLVVQVGIIRPGPIAGKMVHPYLRRRQGREPAECLHPSLEPVLQRTLGVPIFQEQLLRMAMIAAGFTSGEAEELRRALTHKRSEARMKEVEVKLRRGMNRNGITGPAQDSIVQSITAFALYGFPESHAASFALLAYASAYLKCHYLAAFTAALLNNQPMGFYHPSTIIKDAQRHGLKVLPIDVTRSQWSCTLESDDRSLTLAAQNRLPSRDRVPPGRGAVRLGLRYVKGLREEAAQAIVRERLRRPFASIDDLVRRVPELRRDEVTSLAEVGALNFIRQAHRRDALWEAARAARPAGPLFAALEEPGGDSPLAPMTSAERLSADYSGTGVTVGPHPMAYVRPAMNAQRVTRAADLPRLGNGLTVRVAGCVIVRQRPATASGFVFLSLEDETGIINVIVPPDVFAAYRLVLVEQPFLLIDGRLQRQDGVVSVKAEHLAPLEVAQVAAVSHDFC